MSEKKIAVKKNLKLLLLVSTVGKLIYAASSLLALPLIAKVLGAEAVGLVGFFTTILLTMMVLEGGLTSSLIHRLASISARSGSTAAREVKSGFAITNTYVAVFFTIGLFVGLIIWLAAKVLATHWLEYESLSEEEVRISIRYMAVFIALSFPVMILQGALVGREQQVRLNSAYIPYSIMRTVGVVVLLAAMPQKSVKDYFFLQVVVQLAYIVFLLICVYWRSGYTLFSTRPKWRHIRIGLAFSKGVLLVSITSVFLVQYDKVYLSGTLGLGDYAAYTLAYTLAGAPYIFSSALSTVLFPRFSLNIVRKDYAQVSRVFSAALIGLSILLAVFCISVGVFSKIILDLLFVKPLSSKIDELLFVFVLATTVQSLLIVPFTLQLAKKWTSLTFNINVVCIPFVFVALPLVVSYIGAVGGAYVWLGYNLVSILLTFFFVLKRDAYLRDGAIYALRVFVFMAVISYASSSLLNGLWSFADPDIFDVIPIFCVATLTVALGVLLFRKRLMRFA